MDAIRAESEREAEAMQSATQKMMKSEQEKADFRKEADAMEEELGF